MFVISLVKLGGPATSCLAAFGLRLETRGNTDSDCRSFSLLEPIFFHFLCFISPAPSVLFCYASSSSASSTSSSAYGSAYSSSSSVLLWMFPLILRTYLDVFCLACFLSLCSTRSCSSLIRIDFCMHVMMTMMTYAAVLFSNWYSGSRQLAVLYVREEVGHRHLTFDLCWSRSDLRSGSAARRCLLYSFLIFYSGKWQTRSCALIGWAQLVDDKQQ